MKRRHVVPAFALILSTLVAPAATIGSTGKDAVTTTPIKHFVVLMQENHSFDSYFGTYPGADGIPAGACIPVDPRREGSRCIRPYHRGPEGGVDLPNTASVARHQSNDGRMDGFLSAIRHETGRVVPQVVSHLDDRELPYYWNVADNYVLFDRFFSSSRGGSLSNHMYWISGRPGISHPAQEVVPAGGFDLPTIFDRLERKQISWKFYVENYDPSITLRNTPEGHRGSQTIRVPLLNFPRFLDDPDRFGRIVPIERYYRDLAHGTLPAVAYIAPSASSEHPPSGPRAGQALVRSLIGSLMASDQWSTSAFMWTYDNWAGFYDHVPPPAVDRFGYGFRVPALLVSPYAKPGHVEHSTLDFTSTLGFIERNWGLEPLARRDHRAGGLDDAFDFVGPPRAPVILNAERHVPAESEPGKLAVYACYGLSLAGFTFVLGVAGGWWRMPARGPVDLSGASRR